MKPDPIGSTSSTISQREYFEAKLEAANEINQAYHESVRRAMELQAVEYERRLDVLKLALGPVRAELMAVIAAHVDAFSVFKESLARETAESKQTVKDKMEVLNELRRAVETDRALFVRGDKFDAVMQARDAKVESLEKLFGGRVRVLEETAAVRAPLVAEFSVAKERIKTLEDWRNKLLGIGVTIALFAGLVGALLMRLLSGVFGK